MQFVCPVSKVLGCIRGPMNVCPVPEAGELHSRTNKLYDSVAYLKLLCCFLCPYREAALLIIVLSVFSVVRMVYLV